MTKGQRAMAAWMTASCQSLTQEERTNLASQVHTSTGYIGMAKIVAEYAPDLGQLLLEGREAGTVRREGGNAATVDASTVALADLGIQRDLAVAQHEDVDASAGGRGPLHENRDRRDRGTSAVYVLPANPVNGQVSDLVLIG